MSRLVLGIALFLLAGFFAPLSAEDLVKLPNPGHWIVKVESKGKDREAAPARTETKREVWLKGQERYEVISFSDGTQSYVYLRGPVGFENPAGSSDIYVLNTFTDVEQQPGVLRELSWLNPRLSRGTETYQGIECILYETGEGEGSRKAWIEQSTRRPIALEQRGRVYLFQYASGSASFPKVDPKIRSAVDRYDVKQREVSVDLKPR